MSGSRSVAEGRTPGGRAGLIVVTTKSVSGVRCVRGGVGVGSESGDDDGGVDRVDEFADGLFWGRVRRRFLRTRRGFGGRSER